MPDANKLSPIISEKIDVTPVATIVRARLIDLLNAFRNVVAKPGEPLGCANLFVYKIIADAISGMVYRTQYLMPHSQLAEIDGIMQDIMERGVISIHLGMELSRNHCPNKGWAGGYWDGFPFE